jgi:hypothetical protein
MHGFLGLTEISENCITNPLPNLKKFKILKFIEILKFIGYN